MCLKSQREYRRSPSAIGVLVWLTMSRNASTFSDSTGSSMNISLNGSSSFASTFAIGLCTRPWKSTPMPTFGPTASRTARDVVDHALHLVEGVDDLQFFRAVHLHGLEAALDHRARVVGDIARTVAADPRIHLDPVAHLAAEQRMDRHAMMLALDVPQRLVDAGDRAHARSARRDRSPTRYMTCQ